MTDYFKRKDKEQTIDVHLSLCKSQYEETGNPLYVWLAIFHSRKNNRPMKAWIRKYLGEVSENLLKIENPKGDTDVLIKKALGIKTGNQFFEFHNSWKKAEVYDQIVEELKKNQKKKKDHSIYEKVGTRFGISADLAKKYYSEGKKWKERITEEK